MLLLNKWIKLATALSIASKLCKSYKFAPMAN